MTIHSISKTVLLRAGIAFAIWAGATALWQGRVNGFEQEPAAAASEVAPAFPGLHSGVYQQNLLIQVIEDPIESGRWNCGMPPVPSRGLATDASASV